MGSLRHGILDALLGPDFTYDGTGVRLCLQFAGSPGGTRSSPVGRMPEGGVFDTAWTECDRCPMVDWEKCYQDGVTPWDYGRPAPPLLDWIRGNRIEGRVLVPGCGTGHDAAVIARAFPGAEIEGLDISESAVTRARERHGDLENLAFRLGDLFDESAVPAGSFDWIFEHTCFCAIDPARRGDYVRAVGRVLKPGGRLLAVFYLDPYDDEHQPGGGPPHGTTVDELDQAFGDRFAVVDSFVPMSSFPGREGRELLQLMTRR